MYFKGNGTNCKKKYNYKNRVLLIVLEIDIICKVSKFIASGIDAMKKKLKRYI